MNWILVAIVAGHIMTAGTDNQATCQGAAAMLMAKDIAAVCIQAPVIATAEASPSTVWML